MTIAGYAIGAGQGILYLRAEYAYLRELLEHILDERRELGLLGENVGGKEGFDFDIRIQMGAGAYICGEETALISSMRRAPARRSQEPSAVPGPGGLSGQADVGQQRRDSLLRGAHPRERLGRGSRRSGRRAAPAPSC